MHAGNEGTEGTQATPGQEGPVTVTLSRYIKPGREADYEAWVSDVSQAAQHFPGNMGASILRPDGEGRKEYVIILRFDSYKNLQTWEDSAERALFLKRLDGMVLGETRTQRATGLEFWFTLPEVPAGQSPSPHKMALVLIAVLFVLVTAMNLLFGEWLAGLPLLARVTVVVVTQVLLMTYVIMPRVTQLLKSWLFSGT